MVITTMMMVISSFGRGREVGIGRIGYIWILFLHFLWSSEILQECKGTSRRQPSIGWSEVGGRKKFWTWKGVELISSKTVAQMAEILFSSDREGACCHMRCSSFSLLKMCLIMNSMSFPWKSTSYAESRVHPRSTQPESAFS